MKKKNALLVYPEFPPSFWAQNYFLQFVGKKGGMPPLGLLTVAAMLPDHYDARLIDMNLYPLTDEDLAWADVVLTSTMIVQQESLDEVTARCKVFGVPVVAGGPHPTSFHDEISGVDHLVLDEVEESFAEFVEDFEAGRAQYITRTPDRPDIDNVPVPRYDLIELYDYASMAIQFSRGCPFTCEFCDIPKLYGRATRTKSIRQMLEEFDALYEMGWRGPLFLVDDNFIGNKRDAMRLLPAVAEWQKQRNYPFVLVTEASVNMAEMDGLLDAMVEARFAMVFLGLESPNPEALAKTKKGQNTKKGHDDYLLRAVRKIQGKGMEVTGGFILGLDGDGPEVFDAQVDFIQEAGIPIAMVGLLSVLRGTPLYDRYEREGRLVDWDEHGSLIEVNYLPEIGAEALVEGYKRTLSTLYEPSLENYFERCWTMMENLGTDGPAPKVSTPKPRQRRTLAKRLARWRWMGRNARKMLTVLGRSARRQAFAKQGPAYLRFLGRTLRHKREMFPRALRLAMQGYHFQKITEQIGREQVKAAAGYGYSIQDTDEAGLEREREIA